MDTSSLMEQILSKDNLNTAYLQVVRNKGAAGVDGMTVEELGVYLSENGENIREQLQTRKYKPQPVRRVEIPKPDGGTRNLGVPTVTDRFVQQAVAQALIPIFEERFLYFSPNFRFLDRLISLASNSLIIKRIPFLSMTVIHCVRLSVHNFSQQNNLPQLFTK